VSDPDFLRMMDEASRDFDAGDKGALLGAIFLCLEYDEVAPAWVKAYYRDAFLRVISHDFGSWDDAFGRPLKKGAQLAAARRKKGLEISVLNKVWERYVAGQSITKSLFDSIGKEVGVSGTVASEIYHAGTKPYGGPKAYKNLLRRIRPRNSGKI
jgi:hypothetical protein